MIGGVELEKNGPLDMHDFFRNNFPQYDNDELINWLVSHSRVITIKKGDIIFHPETDRSFSLYLLDGIIKTYIISPNGIEYTFAFYYEPGSCICMTKDMINTPGIYCKALTPVKYIKLVGPSPYDLATKYPELYPNLLRVFEPFYFGLLDKLRAFSTLTAKDRYLWFLNKYPDLVDKVSLAEVANFLGITPQSLSRIRTELAEEQGVTPPPKN